MEKKCESASLLHLYIDEELSPEESLVLERHLNECASCQKELRVLQRTNSLLLDIDEVEPSDAFSQAFWGKVDAYEGKRAPGFISVFIQSLWRPRFAAALMVFIITGVFVYKANTFNPGSDHMIMTVDLEMLQDFEIVENLDLLENLDDLMNETEEG